jgi:tetratricopeptide (TPR) repeat protein
MTRAQVIALLGEPETAIGDVDHELLVFGEGPDALQVSLEESRVVAVGADLVPLDEIEAVLLEAMADPDWVDPPCADDEEPLPTTLEECLQLARAKLERDDEPSHVAELAAAKRASMLDPDSAEALALRGRAELLLQLYEQGAAHLDAALRLAPSHVDAQAWRGEHSLRRGDLERARADLQRVTELEPARADAWLGLAEARFFLAEGAEDEAAAVDAASRAVELRPDSAPALSLRGSLHYMHLRPEAAVEDYTRVLELEPDGPRAREALMGRANARLALGDEAGAEADARRYNETKNEFDGEFWPAVSVRYLNRE